MLRDAHHQDEQNQEEHRAQNKPTEVAKSAFEFGFGRTGIEALRDISKSSLAPSGQHLGCRRAAHDGGAKKNQIAGIRIGAVIRVARRVESGLASFSAGMDSPVNAA